MAAEILISQPPRGAHSSVYYLKESSDGTSPELIDIATLNPEFVDAQQVFIKDVRGIEDTFTLENHGFQYIRHSSSVKNFSDDEEVRQYHYDEVKKLVKELCGASEVLIFHHFVRNAPRELSINSTYKGPTAQPHIDISPAYAPHVLQENFPSEYEAIMGKHWMILNLWRPLRTIHRDPLAVTDATSVADTDHLVFTYPQMDNTGTRVPVQGMFTRKGKGTHKWYYLSEQTPEEVLAFKIHDSDQSSKTRVAPHTSFQDPAYNDFPTRESIEVRCIVAF
ncbi:hypothetical protein F5884DRAFT_744585 [Xylogone sp. PMI_703]|nr:hypothetical protein F5884DRAFT_744585 [Xylogone sp. PMI_703]